MQIFLNIIYFLLALTVLVSIHEAGHLTMAKLFNVYCDEYSIGFGPKIYQHLPKGVNKKGKPRETKFTLRAIPLGGYVAMAGEGMEDDEKMKTLPKERFLTGVARWKRAIIMVAGVTLNAILGLILLIVAFAMIPMVDTKSNTYTVSDKVTYTYYNTSDTSDVKTYTDEVEAPVKLAGLTSESVISSVVITYNGNVGTSEEAYSGDKTKTYTINENVTASTDVEGTYAIISDEFNTYIPLEEGATKTYKFILDDGQEISVTTTPYASNRKTQNGEITYDYAWKYIGISANFRSRSFSEVFSTSFTTFGEYASLLYKTIGQLFIGQGFSNLGGPIAIVQQQMTFATNGFGYFLLFWGLISINLAVINLLPFPGLDGWHLLVVIIESITRKEINPKFKSIMSVVGLLLLFGLMIAITIKDLIGVFAILFL